MFFYGWDTFEAWLSTVEIRLSTVGIRLITVGMVSLFFLSGFLVFFDDSLSGFLAFFLSDFVWGSFGVALATIFLLAEAGRSRGRGRPEAEHEKSALKKNKET